MPNQMFRWIGSWRLCESFDEGEGGVGDFAPAAVDREAVSAVLDLDELSHAFVVLLLFVGGLDDGRWHGMVQLA